MILNAAFMSSEKSTASSLQGARPVSFRAPTCLRKPRRSPLKAQFSSEIYARINQHAFNYHHDLHFPSLLFSPARSRHVVPCRRRLLGLSSPHDLH
jgi:hypothetical protein